ncbi:DUF6965 family protein [Leeuwenhoekiella marinoflava]|uniref:Uncharacterized protein n=2 Tax=Leeuwenhoekiella marinoflava TaxID=988 RepID=A0A4Q0P4D4_9FLAO|nr:DUF6371 domain-containing protein [Leeuwenhoekiella marinoflava]RXG21251.1 hypothetical protein DSL99_4056 [Leeuwenhoekiella marinoflava]SHG04888.1 hypothetical protein SAMN02745246_04065 [Leeuwenhoekiella marinoflava DSM 3653]
MANDYRYTLEKGSKKYRCPNCHKKRFVRYVDTGTGNYLPENYGSCDRAMNCGYNLNPYLDGYAKEIWEQEQGNTTDWKPQPIKRIKKPVKKPKRAFIPVEVLNLTRAGYEQNTFIQNLLSRVAFPFEVQDIEQVISLYHLGTVQNGYRKGANTFPFVDVQGNVRAVQVKQFDKQNHTTGTDFLHSIIEKHHTRNNKALPEWLETYNENETKVSCLFGEHLLTKYPYNPVALVEAPKTAIYGTLYFGFPEQPTNLLWLAVYNLSSLNLNKCKALKGRNVFLFPDLSKGGKAFQLWSNKAAEIQKRLQGTYFYVSDLLEQLAPQQDKEQGKDLADYLIKQDWRLFRKQDIKETPQPEPEPVEPPIREKSEKSEALKKPFIIEENNIDFITVKEPDWSNDIAELENYFTNMKLPTQPLKLNESSTITDCSLFVKNHLSTVKANNGKQIYLPYLNRLQELKKALINQRFSKVP